jgi:23S rRNA pseudouridine2605 synthase
MISMRSVLSSSRRPEAAGGMRLHVFIARSGASSRRAAERLIAEGRVSLNGQVVREAGRAWKPGDRVELDGRPLELEARKIHVLLHKPAGYLCTSADPEGRKLALDLVQGDFRERLYGVGRLDQYSSGLFILTNDGEFARLVSHPSSGIEKEYAVESSDPIPPGLAQDFMRGIRVGGREYRAKLVRIIAERRAEVVLVEGKNREIREVFDALGVRLRSLKRVRIGGIGIAGLAEGEYRLLGTAEVEGLVSAARERGLRARPE